MHEPLIALLDHLDAAALPTAHVWQAWQITPIGGGMNNVLYRATSATSDYAVKFTIRDGRARARREYTALSALHSAALGLAPQPIWLDQNRYRQPVVVQTWVAGAPLSAPPASDAEWTALRSHYCAIHSLTPAGTNVEIAEATLNVASGAAGKALVQQHVAYVPRTAQPADLQRLLTRFDAWTPPTWTSTPRALCRVDANWRNFIQRANGWASVDWENSGWGEPAFELADLLTHPAYNTISPTRREWLVATYADQRGDASAVQRIETYYTVMLVWWVVRWTRYLYEVPLGLDSRLASRPSTWQNDIEQHYAQYVARAEEHLNTLR